MNPGRRYEELARVVLDLSPQPVAVLLAASCDTENSYQTSSFWWAVLEAGTEGRDFPFEARMAGKRMRSPRPLLTSDGTDRRFGKGRVARTPRACCPLMAFRIVREHELSQSSALWTLPDRSCTQRDSPRHVEQTTGPVADSLVLHCWRAFLLGIALDSHWCPCQVRRVQALVHDFGMSDQVAVHGSSARRALSSSWVSTLGLEPVQREVSAALR